MPRRTWTDEQLVDAVSKNTTLRGVKQALGLKHGSNDTMRRHITRIGVDASHIRAVEGSLSRRPRAWRDEDLPTVVAESVTYAEVMRKLGYKPSGGIHRWLKAIIRHQGISTEHFRGQGWSKGLDIPRGKKRPLEVLLTAGSLVSSGDLRRRLIKEGLLGLRIANRAGGRSGWVNGFP